MDVRTPLLNTTKAVGMKDEKSTGLPVPSKEELHEKYDVPSRAPGFEGATPQALGRLLFTRAPRDQKKESGS